MPPSGDAKPDPLDLFNDSLATVDDEDAVVVDANDESPTRDTNSGAAAGAGFGAGAGARSTKPPAGDADTVADAVEDGDDAYDSDDDLWDES